MKYWNWIISKCFPMYLNSTETYEVLKHFFLIVTILPSAYSTETYEVLKPSCLSYPFSKNSHSTETYEVLKQQNGSNVNDNVNIQPKHLKYWNFYIQGIEEDDLIYSTETFEVRRFYKLYLICLLII